MIYEKDLHSRKVLKSNDAIKKIARIYFISSLCDGVGYEPTKLMY